MAIENTSEGIATDLNSFFQSYLTGKDGDAVSSYLEDYFCDNEGNYNYSLFTINDI